jgi:putative transposase
VTSGTCTKCSSRSTPKRHYLWRAVSQEGNVLDLLVQSRRHKRAAKRFFPQAAQGPALCAAGHRDGQAQKRWCGTYRNSTRCGAPPAALLQQSSRVSHQPTRQQERQMRRFKSPRQAQRFLSAHGPIANLFRPRRHRMKANADRTVRDQAFKTCQQVPCAQRPE